MSWTLVTTISLDRRTRKLLARHPDLRPRLADTLDKLHTDPFEPGLRLHPLTGKLQGMQAVGLADSYGITLTLQITEHEILLLDIGSRDEVYG
ncbi:MAG: plasmid stabilization protein [Candidatus Accumulibacter sp.]|jgi:mRNA-degrading endonuclease YafQ of YafQ-DinJ toxin-antitoxin module|nr:plasmid stabilization protein [Candidatus Accumulibacter necessarius]